MATAFRRDGGHFVADLDHAERTVVAELMSQTLVLLAPSERESTGDEFLDLVAGLEDTYDPKEVAERDPVVQRLLPDGHRDDARAAGEFRAATERGLREQKSARLASSVDLLAAIPQDQEEVRLDEGDAIAFMMALADVRLALGERLGLHTEDDSDALHERMESMGPEGPRDQYEAVGLYYDFLTWLQETIASSLMSRE